MTPAAAPQRGLPLRTLAPAKINLTLEILGKREDGFHDLISVVQTLDFADDVSIAPGPGRTVEFRDGRGRPLPSPDGDLVARTWQRLAQRCGRDLPGLVRVSKRIPVAGGLGGGSSNAAAFLRLAGRFWDLALPPDDLHPVAAEAGADVPLFLHGGTLLIEGRGERVTSLPDARDDWLGLLLTPELPLPPAKTATMFSALRPRHFADGASSRALATKLATGEAPARADLLNTFDAVVAEVLLGVAAERRRFGRAARAVPLLAGAGPSLFLLGAPADADRFQALASQLAAGGGRARVVRPLGREAATAVTRA